MNQSPITPTLSQTSAAAATLLAVVVLWLGRDVMTLDVVLRMVLPALWLALWTLSCTGAGWPVVAILSKNTGSARTPLVLVVATGAAVLALIGTLLALAGFLSRPILISLLVISAPAGLVVLARSRRQLEILPQGLLSPLAGVLMLPIGAALLLVSTPPVMYDVLHYHLAFPEQWLMAGGFVEFARESFSYYFSAHGILFTFALSTVGPWGANAISWWMAGVAIVAAATLGNRLGGPGAAPWAAACYALTPATLEIIGYANADHVVAAWAGAALVALTDQIDRVPTARMMALAGFLGGAAAASKYLALATVVLPLMAAGISRLRVFESGRRIRATVLLLALGGGVAVPLAPWIGRNVAWTGNPVYPYFTKLFGGPPSGLNIGMETGRNVDLPPSTAGRTAASAGALIIRTFKPRYEGGLLGPHWLFLLPVAAMVAGLRNRLRGPLWTATLVGVLCWGFLVQYVRFLLPVLVGAAALAGTVPPALGRKVSRLTRGAFTALLLAIFAWNASVLLSNLNIDRLATVAGLLDEKDYRIRWIDVAPAADFISNRLPPDACVLLAGESRSFGLKRRVIVEDPYRTPLLVEMAEAASSTDDLARSLRHLGVTHILVNENEMERMARVRQVDDYWTPASDRSRRLIRSFLETRVTRIYDLEKLWVGELTAPPQAPPPVRDKDPGRTAS
ncbi:MAG: hypothetical protein ABFS37_14155 [Acidobacteriota bacterium]